MLSDGNQDTVGEGQAPDESVNGEEAPDSKKPRIAATSSELTVPCFELPEELQEYRGDPDNRKEMMLWRQKLQVLRCRRSLTATLHSNSFN